MSEYDSMADYFYDVGSLCRCMVGFTQGSPNHQLTDVRRSHYACCCQILLVCSISLLVPVFPLLGSALPQETWEGRGVKKKRKVKQGPIYMRTAFAA